MFTTGSIAPPSLSGTDVTFGLEQEGGAHGLLMCMLLPFSCELPQPFPHNLA